MKYSHYGTFTYTSFTIGPGGSKVPGPTTTLYAGKVDVQTNSRMHDKQSGVEVSKGSSTIFFPIPINSAGIKPDVFAILNMDGIIVTGRVDRVNDLDDSCLVLHYSP